MEDVITSSVAKTTYIVAEITFKVAMITFSVAKITFVDREIYKTSNAPKSLYDKLRGASNQIIFKNRVHGQSKSSK